VRWGRKKNVGNKISPFRKKKRYKARGCRLGRESENQEKRAEGQSELIDFS